MRVWLPPVFDSRSSLADRATFDTDNNCPVAMSSEGASQAQ